MKHTLLDLLARITPSRTIINNCLALIQREQVGIQKYNTTLADSPLTHEQLLQHGREEALDLANYLEAAINVSRQAHVDYCSLRGAIETLIKDLENTNPQDVSGNSQEEEDAYEEGIDHAVSLIRQMLTRHESDKVLRQLRAPS